MLVSVGCVHAQDVWSGPTFSADPEALRRAAAEVRAGKDAHVTILLNEYHVSLDPAGRMLKKHHMIYRIETQDAVEGWSEVRGSWNPWYQAKPKIDARVITTDGTVHSLDLKTLGDVPVYENEPNVYTDRKAYGGPLPALAPGAIVEEEVTTRDTAVFFSGGMVERFAFAWSAPVSRTRFVLSHPESLPVRYVLHLLTDAVVKKASAEGTETITIEKGPIEAYNDEPEHAPADALLYPELELATGGSWQQVASAYAHQLSEKLRISDVQPLVAKLELKTSSNLETIRRIVIALHKTVRYTGVEFGESGLIPQFPGETLKRKYGDCKDKATLLIAMLRAAGIPANLALLSAGPGEDTNPELPGMGGFDHAIVYVPATSTSPELWIDATAQHSRVGELPDGDYGRLALIADENTTALKKIPELTAENNVHVETREFTLADYGPAKIVEKNEQTGPSDAGYRDFYDGDEKKIREDSEGYVKDAYLADALISLEKTDPADLEKPFIVTLTAKGRRGFTDLDNASVYVPYATIFDELPGYFRTTEKAVKESDEDKPKPRTVDWVINPFTTEWRYKIVAPPGFKIRALPASKDEGLGTAHFVQKYSSNQEGTVVEATLRFDSGKSRLTVDEAKTLRDAILKARGADGITITFDQMGYSLLSAGKIKEALAIDRQLVNAHPKDALQRVRLARVFLAAGLGEKARTVIKEAAGLDPNSVQVFSEQGWILEHDLIGRRFGKGFDYGGAVAAYRKAKQLDPKNNAVRANLAKLLEYDEDGVRYSKKARLEEAITEFRELKKLDETYARSYDDFIPYDLWYLGKYKELNDHLSGLPTSDLHKALILGAIAAADGAESAIKKSLEIASQEEERSKALVNAGWMLIRVRRYPEAAELLASGAHGQTNESDLASRAAIFKKTKRHEELAIEDSSPTGVIQRLFNLFLGGNPDIEGIKGLVSKASLQFKGSDDDKKELERVRFDLRSRADHSNLTLDVLADLSLSNTRYISEGNDTLGYKVTLELLGGLTQEAFVTSEDGHYKIAEYSGDSKSVPENMGWEVLARLQRKDLAGARKWLDWAREKVHINAGDDPLSGQPFPHFWTKGQEGDETTARTAALILLPSKSLKGQNLAALIDARNEVKNDAARTDLNLVLAYAYEAQQRWLDLHAVAEELVKESPDSHMAFRFAMSACVGLKQFDECDSLIQARLQKHPDEPEYIRSAATLARYRGQFGKARELMKGLIDKGKGSANDLNLYAWDALYIPGQVDQDSFDAAHRASELTKNSDFSILHTLACLHAAVGKTKEAREFLLKAMGEAKMEEPNSAIWLGLASIAEQYGETDAARAMYSRVEKGNVESPGSNYVLAQQRIAALQNGAASAKASGQ